MKKFVIKELQLDEEDMNYGIQAISFVPEPAIETNFEYYAKIKPPFWKWVAHPPTIETSRHFCVDHAYSSSHPNRIYHTDEIKKWAHEDDGTFIPGATVFASFSDNSSTFNGDEQMYNCRHVLERVTSLTQVPQAVLDRVGFNYGAEEMFFNFEVASKEKKQVKGLVLKSDQMIYRPNADGNGNPGYNYMTPDTIRNLKERYGYNRKITFKHQEDITGDAILLDSWLEENESCVGWYMKYQIVGEKLWAQITSGNVKGFSVEMIMRIK